MLEIRLQPFSVRLRGSKTTLDILVAKELPEGSVDGDHFTRSQTTLFNDRVGIQAGSPHLGANDENTIVGDLVTGGTQTIAVKQASFPNFMGSFEMWVSKESKHMLKRWRERRLFRACFRLKHRRFPVQATI